VNTPGNTQRMKDFLLIPDRGTIERRPGTILRAVWHGREQVRQSLEAEFRPVFMTTTTGRSADPIPFLFTLYDLANLTSAGKRLFEVCGTRRDWRAVNLFPYAPHLAFWQTHYGGTAFDVFVASTGGGKVMG